MKKLVWLILGLVVFVAIVLFVVFNNQRLVTPTNCDLKSSLSERMSCLVTNAVSSKDINQCNAISDAAYKSDCLSKVSAALKNCNSLRTMEKAACYQVWGTNEKDITICDKARDSTYAGSESFVYSCYVDVAKAKNDASICETLRTIEINGPYKNTHYTDICLANFK